MVTQRITVEAKKNVILLGIRGETGVTEVVFDVTKLIEDYGDGTAVLMAKRAKDRDAYPVVVTRNGAQVTWKVNFTDTAYRGYGKAELFWYVNDALAKSIVYETETVGDIQGTKTPAPDGYENWVEELTALGAETLENAVAAQTARDEAETRGRALWRHWKSSRTSA